MEQGIGTYIRDLRTARGWSVERLARAGRVAPSTLRRWEGGGFQPRLDKLDRVLAALGASAAQRRHAAALVAAPRGARRFHDAVVGRAGDDEEIAGWMPGAGDLWWALRTRRGITARQVAGALRVHPSQVSRWEHSRCAPPEELLGPLFDLLEARPEERTALANRRLVLAAPLRRTPDALEDYEHRLAQVGERVARGEVMPGDLALLTLESQLWPLAARRESARELLARTYTLHAEWLVWRGRSAEAGRYAFRTLGLLRPAERRPEDFWFCAVNCAAHAVAHGRRSADREVKRRAHRQAFGLIHSWLDVAMGTPGRSNLCRDLAEYAGHMGDLDAAFALIGEARGLAENEEQSKLGRHIHAALLVQAGRAEEALPLLPEPCPPEVSAHRAALELSLWAGALADTGDVSAAHDCLNRFFAVLAEYDLPHLTGHVTPVVRQLEGRRPR